MLQMTNEGISRLNGLFVITKGPYPNITIITPRNHLVFT